ncbi:MAG TPA: zf-HC2 domain-containing protein [Terriglobales bacterium]|jgi:predicted anti-sigma-YlaC factor YlaD|nr:zf-HC2 domain-containing protein [Terriglobales bacterium]
MTRDTHDEARELIALGEGLSDAQQAWLRAHLEACAPCRDYAEAADRLVRTLRSLPLAADSRLVRATQMRVRFHAGRLRETRERMWLVGMACLGVGLSATLTVPLLWRLFAWMGEWAGVSTPVWQAGFMFFFIAPALVVSVLLLARGTHLTNDGEKRRR